MVLSKRALFCWLLVTLAIGAACGYLFSSKFCSVSIGRRAEQISTLNQTLRKLFSKNVIWTYEYLKAKTLNSADTKVIEEKLVQTNSQIGQLFKAYYDNTAAQTIGSILNEKKNILDNAFDGSFSTGKAQEELGKISFNLGQYLNKLNPNWNASSFASTFISEIGSQFIQIISDLKNKRWESALDLFSNNLDLSLQSADELHQTLMQQFPQKF